MINLILVLIIWWCPCIECSLLLLEEGVCYDQCIVLAKLLAFALLRFVLWGQIFLLYQVSLDFLLCIPVPYNEKDIFLGVSFPHCTHGVREQEKVTWRGKLCYLLNHKHQSFSLIQESQAFAQCMVRPLRMAVLLLSIHSLLSQCLLHLQPTNKTDFPTYFLQAPVSDCSYQRDSEGCALLLVSLATNEPTWC